MKGAAPLLAVRRLRNTLSRTRSGGEMQSSGGRLHRGEPYQGVPRSASAGRHTLATRGGQFWNPATQPQSVSKVSIKPFQRFAGMKGAAPLLAVRRLRNTLSRTRSGGEMQSSGGRLHRGEPYQGVPRSASAGRHTLATRGGRQFWNPATQSRGTAGCSRGVRQAPHTAAHARVWDK